MTKRKPRLMIIGHSDHGKDHITPFIAEALNLSFIGSSDIANEEFVFDTIKDEFGYETKKECYLDRNNHRPLWHNVIKLYNYHDKAALSRLIFSKCDIYVGCRNTEEFTAAKKAELFDFCILVDASKIKPLESNKSFNICTSVADFTFDNNDWSDGKVKENIDLLVRQIEKVWYGTA